MELELFDLVQSLSYSKCISVQEYHLFIVSLFYPQFIYSAVFSRGNMQNK